MTTLRLHSIPCGALLAAACVFAGESTPAPRAFVGLPGPDAEYLLLVDRYTLKDDGDIVHEREMRLKLNSFLAFNRRFGESRLEFDPAVEKVETLYNRTVLPDGTVVVAPANAVVDDLPPAAQRSPLWAGLRRRVFVHTALEPGAVIELGWRTTRASCAFLWLEASEPMAADVPIKERIVQVELPASVELRGGVANIGAENAEWAVPAQRCESSRATYVWRRSGVESIPDEPGANARDTFVPMVRVSTCQSAAALASEWARRIASAGPVPADAAAALKDALARETDWERRVLTALDVLPKVLSASAIAPTLQHWQPRALNEAWQASVATPLELCIFQAAVLGAVGIEAQPALAGVRGQDLGACPAFASLDRALVRIKDPAGVWRLYDVRDAARGTPLELATDLPLLATEAGAAEVARTPPPWRRAVTVVGELAPDGAFTGSLSFTATNGATPHAALVKDAQGLAGELAAAIVPAGKARDVRVTVLGRRTGALTCGLEGTLPGANALGLVEFDVSKLAGGVDAALPVVNPGARTCPVALPGPGVEELDYTLTLPKGWNAAALPAATSVRNSAGEVSVKAEACSDGKIRVVRCIALAARELSPSAAEDARALVNAWRDLSARALVLRLAGK
jgi:hypothetical protein